MALKGQKHFKLKNKTKHQHIEKCYKSTQNTTNTQASVFWRDGNVMDQLQKWQAYGKQLIANIYLQY